MAQRRGLFQTLYLANRAKQGFGKAKKSVGSGIGFVKQSSKFIRESAESLQRKRQIIEYGEEEAFERRNAERIDRRVREKELIEMEKKFAEMLGVKLRQINSNPRMKAMIKIIYEIFGKNISLIELRKINGILGEGLHKNSPILFQSRVLREAINRIKFGQGKAQDFEILKQASFDLIAQDQEGRQILEQKGII